MRIFLNLLVKKQYPTKMMRQITPYIIDNPFSALKMWLRLFYPELS